MPLPEPRSIESSVGHEDRTGPSDGGVIAGALLSLPIWAAVIVWGSQIIRAIEHFSRWAWMVR